MGKFPCDHGESERTNATVHRPKGFEQGNQEGTFPNTNEGGNPGKTRKCEVFLKDGHNRRVSSNSA